MILSCHPLFVGDRNLNCAGRAPGQADRIEMQAAEAVVLPQGCRPEWYWTARRYCEKVFPNYTVRFRYPGKIGQIRLFRETGAPHPPSRLFMDLEDYRRCMACCSEPVLDFPLVFKFDWGGEGDAVFCLRSSAELNAMLQHAAKFERGGQKGFLLQRKIAAAGRSLRVAVIGRRRIAYWRVGDSNKFYSTVSRGAGIDTASDPQLQQAGLAAVGRFCRRTGIDLAGFDLLFENGDTQPLFLEINWYFGRRGLGGSEAYYAMLLEEIDAWLRSQDLKE